MLKVDYAIVSAMTEEIAPFFKYFNTRKVVNIGQFEFTICEHDGAVILLSPTGFGANNAAITTTFIINHFHPTYVLFSGTAGGIDNRIGIRDVVIATRAFQAEIQGAFTTLIDTPFESCLTHPIKNQKQPNIFDIRNENVIKAINSISSNDIKVWTGTAASADTFPAPQELFDSIKAKKPLSIDMETASLYQAGWVLDVPIVAVRGISNIITHEGTDNKEHASDVSGSSNNAAKILLRILEKL